MLMKPKILVPEGLSDESVVRLSKYAEVLKESQLGSRLDVVLPEIECLLVFSWPRFLGSEQIRRMKSLKFVQGMMVGVNHLPLEQLPRRVVVCSNSGAYSTEVGEFAWGLILAAAKKIVWFHGSISSGNTDLGVYKLSPNDVVILKGKTLGIIGLGGIGRYVARLGIGAGMRICALARRRRRERGVVLLYGEAGLRKLLSRSNVILLSVPLTKLTKGMIGKEELALMKRDAILVNIARGDLIEQEALYNHLVANPLFRYATDVWWYEGGAETLRARFPFLSLHNFVGTPHVSGPSAVVTGGPERLAVRNLIRYLSGRRPIGVVNRSEYV
jgi:phosphoglycerate dehydrogenase-like enzyme